LPTTETYKILRDFLSSRVLEVSRMRSALDVERLRFGGMDAPSHVVLSMCLSNSSILFEHAATSQGGHLDGVRGCEGGLEMFKEL
jgi:hypothetical protein